MRATTPGSALYRVAVLASVVALGVGIAGCDGSEDSEGSADDQPSATETGTQESSPTDEPTTNGSATGDNGSDRNQGLLTAGQTVLDDVGSGTVTSIDSERDGTVWEVQVVTSGGVEQEAIVAANGNKILTGPRTKQTDAEDKAENRNEVNGAELDFRAAVEKVVAAQEGKVTELNLDDHRGSIVWEADVHRAGTKFEVKIDAATGRVVSNNASTGGDDDDDD